MHGVAGVKGMVEGVVQMAGRKRKYAWEGIML